MFECTPEAHKSFEDLNISLQTPVKDEPLLFFVSTALVVKMHVEAHV